MPPVEEEKILGKGENTKVSNRKIQNKNKKKE